MKHTHLAQSHSTQEFLRKVLNKKNDDYLISTDNQTAGKGRSGSQWIQFNEAIAFSFNIPPNKIMTLTSLEIGVLLTLYFKKKIKVKWPNDLLNEEHEKVGGILCQLIDNQILVGIGINLKSPCKDPNFPYPVGGILEANTPLEKDFKREIPLDIYRFITSNRLNSDDVRRLFVENCIHMNEKVIISDHNKKREGKFIGVGEFGEALIQDEYETIKILTGSLRLV